MIGPSMPPNLTAPVPVLDIELTESFGSLLPQADRGAYVLVRLHGRPMAQLWCGPGSMPRDREALLGAVMSTQGVRAVWWLLERALERPVERLPFSAEELLAPAAPVPESAPTVTVAVGTRERPEMLGRCLAALAKNNHRPREILVVENGEETDVIRRIVQEHDAVYLSEPRRGLNLARQRAVLAARGDVIAFTDDDAVPDAGWVGAIARAFAGNPEVSAVTGLVVPLELETAAQLLFEAYGGFGRGLDRRRVWAEQPHRPVGHRIGNAGSYGTGASMAFRREALAWAGAFDPALDVGTAAGCGGELEMFFRVLKLGGTLTYEPSVVVRHEHRRDLNALEQQITSWGRGFAAYAEAASRRFPEERASFALLTMWLAASWHLRRIALRKDGEQFPRRLVLRELRGLTEGRGEYVTHGNAVPVPYRAPRPRPTASVVEREVDLSHPLQPLTDVDRASTVRLQVRARGRHVGTVLVRHAGAPVGVSRMREAIAAELSPRLLSRASGAIEAWQRELVMALRAPRAVSSTPRASGSGSAEAVT
ncbi:MAG TPA: glycosyltransferase [Gemmatimonadaceae bacterium]|nr:glycosyltransferase [Gemmatimonadaceae bacterium]